jgi:hypothetical protein
MTADKRARHPEERIVEHQRHAGLTLEAVQRATNTAAAQERADTAVAGSGWAVTRVARDGVRLEPPHSYWATYRVRVAQ